MSSSTELDALREENNASSARRSLQFETSLHADVLSGAQRPTDIDLNGLLNDLPDIRFGVESPSSSDIFSPNVLGADDYRLRRADIERNVQREIFGQESRENSLNGSIFLTGGVRGGSARGLRELQFVRNNNWDAALNIGADPIGFLGDVPGIQNELERVSASLAERKIDDIRSALRGAGLKNIPDYELNIGGSNGTVTRDYGRTVSKLGEAYENYIRDQRLRETWGEDYQSLRFGKSNLTVQELESKTLTLQQKSADRAYEKGLDLLAQGKLDYSEGKYATVLGNYVDKIVREDLRAFARSEGINENGASNILAINRRLKSDTLPYYGIPDGRLGLNTFHDTTLATKSGYTEQIQRWNELRPGGNFIIVRPSALGGAYVVPRISILPISPPVRNFGRKF